MKKLLILLLFSPLALLSQNKIVIKSSQVTISSLAPIAASTVVANATNGIATPTAVQLGVGLTFSGGKLAIDTANFKDTIYAKNGLQIIGTGFNQIGLGGFLSMNTNISGSNAWAMTLDSMQAATGRGFRVNFGSDAGWDLFTRDSATGFWTRIAKGTPGQGLIMLPGGGIGWGTVSGGGSAPVVQTITSGPTVTINDATDILQVNATVLIASLTITLPTNWPTNKLVKICFTANGTITSGNTMVTSITVVNGSGQTLSQSVNPNGTSMVAGENIAYGLIGTIDQRLQ